MNSTLPWYPTTNRQDAGRLRARADEIAQLKAGQARRMFGFHICALAFLVQIFIGMLIIVIYVLYPRSNGVHILNVETANFSCPAGSWIKDNTVGMRGKCYLFITTTTNVTAASEECLTLDPDSHLVSIKSAHEQAAIKGHHEALAPASDSCGLGYWTSGRRPSPATTVLDEFYWFDGSDVRSTYTNWKSGQPDSSSAQCILTSPQNDFKWLDAGCSGGASRCYICELVI